MSTKPITTAEIKEALEDVLTFADGEDLGPMKAAASVLERLDLLALAELVPGLLARLKALEWTEEALRTERDELKAKLLGAVESATRDRESLEGSVKMLNGALGICERERDDFKAKLASEKSRQIRKLAQ